MNTYVIKKTYPAICDNGEISIESENLYYSEMFASHSGCQCNNTENQDQIHEKCRQIVALIRQIEDLNKTKK